MKLSFFNKLLFVKEMVLSSEDFDLIPSGHHARVREDVEEIEAVDFEYLANGRKYNGFYARLRSLSEEEKHPVVILNRGGSGLFGYIDAKYIFSGPAVSIIKAGYIVIGSQCMGLAEDGAADEMGGEDFASILKLKEFIDNDEMADAGRIGLYGGSWGAIATFRLLAETDWARAAVVASGLLDCCDDSFRPKMAEHYVKMFGGSQEEREKRSVLCWPEKLPKNVPILLLYGTSDWRVDPRSALRLSEKFLDLKIPHRLILLEGNDHFLTESLQERRMEVIAWLNRFVRNDGALPNMEPHGK